MCLQGLPAHTGTRDGSPCFKKRLLTNNRLESRMEANVENKILASMSADALWRLREELDAILKTKMGAERQKLERRLARLNGSVEQKQKPRRPYPKVHPKYCNPERPSETWSGRGKQPHWVEALLRSGMKVDDLMIARTN